ncbi:hypothetical protein [Hymenobacter rigui]|uniref:DUF4476 domain-containing protein n=1 Tax=Hymenobacter rigui TaxID=334424 RepID=A0A3R9N6P2_9BACT|nr:hypothetical protein [Hymenobacter rigui]RSK49477.1 hypothetical protein EI291_08275 [Hymenobacter rigui]
MSWYHPIPCSAVLSLLLAHTVNAQTIAPDSSRLTAARTLTEQRYTQAIQDQSRLYNGTEYVNYARYYQASVGNQFFVSPDEAVGEIEYDGRLYGNIPLRYDLRTDQVIVKQPTSSFYVQLVPERVKRFSVHGHQFVRLEADSANAQGIRSGFYDLLLDKQVKVFARRTKQMQTQPSQNVTKAEFYAFTQYLIQVNNALHSVKSKGSVISLFPERRKELQRYAHDNRLAFTKETREQDIIRLADYYTSLPAAPQANASK